MTTTVHCYHIFSSAVLRVNSAVERRFNGCDLRFFPSPEGVTRIQRVVLLNGASKDRRATESRLRATHTNALVFCSAQLPDLQRGRRRHSHVHVCDDERAPARPPDMSARTQKSDVSCLVSSKRGSRRLATVAEFDAGYLYRVH